MYLLNVVVEPSLVDSFPNGQFFLPFFTIQGLHSSMVTSHFSLVVKLIRERKDQIDNRDGKKSNFIQKMPTKHVEYYGNACSQGHNYQWW
jgi:hypothetical protein